MQKILFASNNKGKLQELKEIFNDYEILCPKDIGLNLDVLEDGQTFLENAKKKAYAFYNASKSSGIDAVIADDSGLCVIGLGNWPGIYTHRITDESDEVRNQMIIDRVDAAKINRDALFTCSLVYYNGENFIEKIGNIKGLIADTPKGTNGFGFDSIFILNDINFNVYNGKTLAELTPLAKNTVSARKLAALELQEELLKENVLEKRRK